MPLLVGAKRFTKDVSKKCSAAPRDDPKPTNGWTWQLRRHRSKVDDKIWSNIWSNDYVIPWSGYNLRHYKDPAQKKTNRHLFQDNLQILSAIVNLTHYDLWWFITIRPFVLVWFLIWGISFSLAASDRFWDLCAISKACANRFAISNVMFFFEHAAQIHLDFPNMYSTIRVHSLHFTNVY